MVDGVVLISLDWLRVSLAFDRHLSHAQAITWVKLLEAGSLSAARNKCWLRSEGKEYVINEEGGVTEFLFNV